MLDLEEEALDEIAFAIERIVTGHLWGCFSRGDDRDSILAVDGVPECLGIVALIAQNVLCGGMSRSMLKLEGRRCSP